MDKINKISVSYNNPLLVNSRRSLPNQFAIVGSGTIGPDIGYYLKSQLPESKLFLVDIVEESLFLAEKRINTYLDKGIKYRKISKEKARKIKKNIFYTTKYEDITDCGLIIEAATENINLKKTIFSKIETLVSNDAIITSNTSSIPGNRIFSRMSNPGRTAVTHFFAPAWRNALVEVVGWDKTEQETVDFLSYLFVFTGKVPVTTKDKVCFMFDRIFDNWCNEAAYLLTDISAREIDKIAEEFVYAGPFFVLNMAKGNQIIFETNSLQMEEGVHYQPSKIFKSVDFWLTGKPGERLEVSDKVRHKIRDRLLGVLFSQTFDIIDNGIGSLEDLNLGCELALGFRQGPISLMKKIGQKEVERISSSFKKNRAGFPESKHPFNFYQKFKHYVLEDTIDGVKIITIRRPQVMNALNSLVTQEILNVFESYHKDPSIKGFILTGYGRKAFSAGADIGEFLKMLGNYNQAVQYAEDCSKVQCFMDKMNKPVVSAINGLVLGGGLEIAIRSHGIIADINSVFQFPEVRLGILPGIGGCVIPYRKWSKGHNVFDRMLMLGEKIGSKEANRIGMVDSVTEGYDSLILKAVEKVHQLEDKIKELDKQKNTISLYRLLEMPSIEQIKNLKLSLETVKIIKETIELAFREKDLENALKIGYKGFGRIACTDSAKEGISAFIQNRAPVFKN